MMQRYGQYGAPMNVIINVGPGIHVDVDDEDGRRGMGRRGMMGDGRRGMMGDGMPMRDMPGGPGAGMGPGGPMAEQLHDLLAERFEGGLAFLRTELRVRPEQEGAWNAFAARIREAATRFRAARDRVPVPRPAPVDQRLAAREARSPLNLNAPMPAGMRSAAARADDAQRSTVEQLSGSSARRSRPDGPRHRRRGVDAAMCRRAHCPPAASGA